MKKKPRCKLIGTDDNVFALAGKVRAALRKHSQENEAKEFGERLVKCESYQEALVLMMEYVEVY